MAKSFILSHGSWEERWKLSVIPNGKLRWTVKTDTDTKDLDSSFPLALHHFYHVTVSYTGYSLQLYIDGVLDSYIPHSGLISITDKAMTFGQKSETETAYYLTGALDEVRIYDHVLSPEAISTLKTIWTNSVVTGIEELNNTITVFPNPTVNGVVTISGIDPVGDNIELFDIAGQAHAFELKSSAESVLLNVKQYGAGAFIIVIHSKREPSAKK